MLKVCEWSIAAIGDWWTEWECAVCEARIVTAPEDMERPEDFPCYINEMEEEATKVQ